MKGILISALFSLAIGYSMAVPVCPADDGTGDILLANPADCTSYYLCVGGTPTLLPCPPGLHWADSLKRCEYPDVAQCEETEEQPTSTEGTSTDRPSTSQRPSTTRGPVPDSCPAENGPEDVLLPNPEDCGSFFKCLNGIPHLIHCPPGQEWSIELNRCDLPEIAQCTASGTSSPSSGSTSTPRPEVPSECPEEDGPEDVLLPNPADCGSFFKCLNGIPHLIPCPAGQEWSIALNRCDLPEIAQCVEEGFHKSPLSEEVNEDGCPAVDGPEDVLLPNPADCGSFFKCLAGTPIWQECPEGLHWNNVAKYCDYPEVAQCVETETRKGLLPSRRSFKSSFQEESSEEEEEVEENECPLHNDGYDIFFPNPEDCSTYYQCSNGEKILKECPVGTLWDAGSQRCDHAAVAVCAE